MTRPRVVRAMLAIAGALVPAPLLACPVCFGAGDGPMGAGLNAGVMVLLGVTAVVLSGFAAGIVAFVRRASHAREQA